MMSKMSEIVSKRRFKRDIKSLVKESIERRVSDLKEVIPKSMDNLFVVKHNLETLLKTLKIYIQLVANHSVIGLHDRLIAVNAYPEINFDLTSIPPHGTDPGTIVRLIERDVKELVSVEGMLIELEKKRQSVYGMTAAEHEERLRLIAVNEALGRFRRHNTLDLFPEEKSSLESE